MIEEDVSTFGSGAFDAGIAAADNPVDPGALMREKALTKYWLAEIDRVRAYDEAAYKQLAKDRSYAAGESSFLSKTNVIGSYIDTWHSLLYARDPDIDVMPKKYLERDVRSMPQLDPVLAGMMPPVEDPALKLQEDAIDFSKTLQPVLHELWRRAKLKDQADPWTRAALTSFIGWLKVTWQSGEAEPESITSRPLQDMRDNLARLEAQIKASEGDYCGDIELQKAELELAIQALDEPVDEDVAKGLCVDAVDMADITVSDAIPTIARYREAPWISHRVFMPYKDALVAFPNLPEALIKSAATYSPKKPVTVNESADIREVSPTEADSFTMSTNMTSEGGFICIEEVQNRRDNQILTFIRGIDRMAKPAFAPPPTERFYNLFALTLTEVDGRRWGQSLNERSQPLQDEYNRTTDGFREHRARVKPFNIFNRSAMEPADATALQKAERIEWVGLKPINPKMDIRQIAQPMAYPQIDVALYTTDPLMARFELIWGLQEAMTATLDTPKTATEAEIQQTGTMSRTGSKRDRLESVLTDIANYTAQLALGEDGLKLPEVQEIVGPNAFWPEGLTIPQLYRLASVEIRAGSSGKPNTKAQRESWAELVPMIAQGIEKIAMLRQSTPQDIADCLEELMKETVDRSGERLDINRFMPLPGPMMGMPMAPVGPDGMPVPQGGAPAPDAPPGAPPADPGFPVPR